MMADEIDSADAAEADGATAVVIWARGKLTEHKSATGDWQSQAMDAFACVAGNQWAEEAREQLEQDDRPVFTFNRVASFIRGICGLESSTRNQVQLFARENSDSGATDVLNAAVRYVREGCDADDEESDAFKDMLICGLGWTETLFTTEESAEGNIVIERVDPMHMRWDPAARKRGLADRRWCARVKYLPYSTIRDVWGDAKAKEVEGVLASDSEILDEFSSVPHDATAATNYDSDTMGQARRKNGVPVIQFQYVKTARFVRIANPTTGETEEVTEAEFKKIEKLMRSQGMELQGEKVKHREYRQVIFCGGVELEEGPLPCDGFTFQAITGIRDRNEGIWYGFIRDLLDPQRWVNKFFSSMADVVASQAKGGLMAEVDAFVNKDNAADDWNNPRSIVWLKRDGLNKVRERNAAGVPAGLNQLLDFTVSSLPAVAGVNLEFLGMADREQPGVLEHQRKQAAISTLSEFFNALRLYRKQQGRILLQFIREFISDGRMIRIVGKKNAVYVPLTKEQSALEYDIVVDEAPTSPDQKNRTWQALSQILPVASNMGLPIPPEILEYAPFPQALIDEWKKFAEENKQLPPEAQAKMQQMQEQVAGLTKQNEQLKSKKEESMAKIQMDGQQAQQNIEIKKADMLADIELAREKFKQEMALEWEKLRMQMELERAKVNSQAGLEREKMFREQTQELDAPDVAEGELPKPKPGIADQLTETLREASKQSQEAMEAMAEAVKALADAQTAPKTITDGKGRSFTVKRGD
jgi:hypothetical protein